MKTFKKSLTLTLSEGKSQRLSPCICRGIFIMEIWKDVIGYEGIYQVSNLGRVKSLSRVVKKWDGHRTINSIILKQSLLVGYPSVMVSVNNISKRIKAHRIVAIAFIPNPENKPCVNHINGIKTDNRVENLEWCTHSENQIHAFKTGLNKVSIQSKGKFIKRTIERFSKPVIDLQTGIFYDSAIEVSITFNINKFTLYGKLNGRDNNNTQFIYV